MELVTAFLMATNAFSLPPGLLSAVCYVESGHTVEAIRHNDGIGDSLGVCQIQESTAKSLGYRGSKTKLWKDPKTNAYWAGAYLNKQLTRYDHDLYRAISAYNMGTHKTNKKGSTINRVYVKKVFDAWVDGK